MKNQELEQLLATEMENVHGGAQNQDTCVCERGGAGATIVVNPEQQEQPETKPVNYDSSNHSCRFFYE